MLDFKLIKDKATGEEWIETSTAGKSLLTIPQLNKGTAFTEEERHLFGLLGKLPPHLETLEEQVQRAYQQYQAYANDTLQKHIYLNNLHDKNQVLFYKLVSTHLTEMMPLIYTPVVGTAVKEFSREYRQPRGLYLAYPYRDHIETMLDNRSNPEIDLIVVTDGEGVLGIGDQGVGAMDIPIAKLMVYTLCGGIDPTRTLPIQLDVGTNNVKLLSDPFYLGWRHPRIDGQEYEDFIEQFITAVKRKFPNAFLHWEDFGRNHARRNLDRYRDQLCSFNDDIQGTGAVALAALSAAVKSQHSSLREQRIVIFGSGTAGTGVADQIFTAMLREGLSASEAKAKIWLIDRQGLLLNTLRDLTSAQQPYAHTISDTIHWKKSHENLIDLADVVKNVEPTILIGCAARTGAFTKEIIQEMASHVERPIIFPLSNPTEYSEATPADICQWTQGQALIATGSPFEDIVFKDRVLRIAQCNNALIFPGIGLGILASKAKRLTDDMLWAACQALCENAPIFNNPDAALLPSLEKARDVAKQIAIALAMQAQQEGLAQYDFRESIETRINEISWTPHYCRFKKSR